MDRKTIIDASVGGSQVDPDGSEENAHSEIHSQANTVGEKVAGIVEQVSTGQSDGARVLTS